MRIVFVGQGPNQTAWNHGATAGLKFIAADPQTVVKYPDGAARINAVNRWAENYCRRVAITGAIGRKLATLAGYNVAARGDLLFYRGIDRRNLNARWNGKLGKGDVFDRAEAEVAAKKLLEDPALTDARFVLLGREVARAFGMDSNQPLTIVEPWNTKQAFLIFPHPSGISTWWNNPDNAERARVALRSFLNR